MYFYINPRGVVSLPVNFGLFYKFTICQGKFLSIEEMLNGACSMAFAGCVEGMSMSDIFKMCYFAVNSNDKKLHRNIIGGALKWIVDNMWRSGKLPLPPLGSTFMGDGTLNILGPSSDELISKVSEAISSLTRSETMSSDIFIHVSVARSPAKAPANPITHIEVQSGAVKPDGLSSKTTKPSRPRSSAVPQGKRAGTPSADDEDDEDDD